MTKSPKTVRKEKAICFLFWAFVCTAALVVLSRQGYSDGDDAYFYQYAHEMDFFSYLKFRYYTWVGRLSGEAMVYLTFRLGLPFWRVVNALMLVLLPIGILRLARIVSGVKDEPATNLWTSMTAVTGYLLMSAMTFGYAAVWVNGSIFYTWSFAFGIWALVPVAEVVLNGKTDWKNFLYGIPCALIASMSIEQMGAVLMTFEVLAILYLYFRKKQTNWLALLQTLLTIASVIVLLVAPGNDVRVETETVTWLPEYATISLGQHLFITIQWLVSSFANENKLFLVVIWLVGIFLLLEKKEKKKSDIFLLAVAVLASLVALLPYVGIHVLSDVGLNGLDTTIRMDTVPAPTDLTGFNMAVLLWWTAALVFTFFYLWKISGHAVILLAYLAGIASEAIMFFSPTMYASGARVFYLTDLLYLFILLSLSFRICRRKSRGIYYGIVAMMGVINFIIQIPIFWGKL